MARIMYVASEAAPLAKTGGLGDVAGALPAALARLGHEVCLVIPAYQQIDKSGFSRLDMGGASAWAGRHWPIEAWQADIRGCRVFLLGTPQLFNRTGLYSGQEGDYSDNLQRFAFFSRAVIALSQVTGFAPHILHVNDWQTSLLPAILRTGATEASPLDKAGCVLTIHNLAYQGIFPAGQFFHTGLHSHLLNMRGVEFWGNISLLKAGIVFADAVNTVSPTYAEEIKTPQLGHGMDGVLRDRGGDVLGIVNGADYELWSPQNDALLPARYGPDNLRGKKRCRAYLLAKAGLAPVKRQPVMGMVGRLTHQKGLDILTPALDELLTREDCRVAILGAGERHYEDMLQALASRYPRRVALITSFSEEWAHLIQAGSDMLLMPSLYEPCGLSQLYALRYGALPVVRATGGLKDTIEDCDGSTQGTGFVFDDYSPRALLEALRRALAQFNKPSAWRAVMRAAMLKDFSWDKSARQYSAMYESYRRYRY